jgi:glutaconate CoA-transferase, subunit B
MRNVDTQTTASSAAAQVDQHGTINMSVIGSIEHPRVRLPASGGANDIFSLCNQVFIVTQHEPRRFVERVDFITSPGYVSGGDSRARAGLVCGRLGAVVTDLALLDFEPESLRMRLRAVQAGVIVEQVRAQTGFEFVVGHAIEELDSPSAAELAIYRELRDGRAPAGVGGAAASCGCADLAQGAGRADAASRARVPAPK